MPTLPEKIDDFLTRHLAFYNYKCYVKRINLKEDGRVLEIGCGGGNLSRLLVKKIPKGKILSIDISDHWIKKAKARFQESKNIKFEQKNILNLNQKNHFDTVIINFVLHDIKPKNRKQALAIINKSLKKDGRVFIREPTRKSHGMSSVEIKRLMLKEGFQKVASKEGYSFPLRGKVYEGIFRKNISN